MRCGLLLDVLLNMDWARANLGPPMPRGYEQFAALCEAAEGPCGVASASHVPIRNGMPLVQNNAGTSKPQLSDYRGHPEKKPYRSGSFPVTPRGLNEGAGRRSRGSAIFLLRVPADPENHTRAPHRHADCSLHKAASAAGHAAQAGTWWSHSMEKGRICIEQLEGYLLNGGAAYALDDDGDTLVVPLPTIRFRTPDGEMLCPARLSIHPVQNALRFQAVTMLPNGSHSSRTFKPITSRGPHGGAGVHLMLMPRLGSEPGKVDLTLLVAIPATGLDAALFQSHLVSFRSMVDLWAARFQRKPPRDRFFPPAGDTAEGSDA